MRRWPAAAARCEHEGRGERGHAPGLEDVGGRRAWPPPRPRRRARRRATQRRRRRGRCRTRGRRGRRCSRTARRRARPRRRAATARSASPATSASSPPIATCGMPAANEPQPMATKNSSPESGLSWNITCPMPRRLKSTKRSTLDACAAAFPPSASSPCHRPLPGSAPEERRRIARPVTSSRATAQNSRTLALTWRSRGRRLEDQAGVVRQPAGAGGDAVSRGPRRRHARMDPVGHVLGREQDHVAEHVERAHHARLPHRAARRVDQQLLAEERRAVGALRPRRRATAAWRRSASSG